jgi:uncharacterized phage protein gp47/JayE
MADTFTTFFEEDENTIRDRMLANPSLEAWRKEPGDFIYDAVAATPLEVKQLQVNQDTILKNAFPQYAEGEFMDAHLDEIGLTREQATPNKRTLTISADAGVVIPAGHTASVVILDAGGNPLEFAVDAAVPFDVAGIKTVAITCKTAGLASNIPNGSQFILLPPIPGVRSIADGGTTIAGGERETDAAAWQRYLFKVSNEDTGGNKNDYVRWATEFEGVGKAKCLPRWAGNGTVKLVILGDDFTPATPTVVTNLQVYMDPGAQGLGEGRAPCGAAVTVEAAGTLTINVAADVVLDVGAILVDVQAAFTASLEAYLRALAFVESSGTPLPVAYNQIGAKLITTPGVLNYSGLTVNGGTADIPVGSTQAPVAGTVTIT